MRHVARRGGGIPPTKHCSAYRREDDGSGGAGSGREAETPSTAPNSRWCQARPRFGSIAGRTEAGGGELRRTRPRWRICIRRAGRRTRKSPALHREYRCPNRGRTLTGKSARLRNSYAALRLAKRPLESAAPTRRRTSPGTRKIW